MRGVLPRISKVIQSNWSRSSPRGKHCANDIAKALSPQRESDIKRFPFGATFDAVHKDGTTAVDFFVSYGGSFGVGLPLPHPLQVKGLNLTFFSEVHFGQIWNYDDPSGFEKWSGSFTLGVTTHFTSIPATKGATYGLMISIGDIGVASSYSYACYLGSYDPDTFPTYGVGYGGMGLVRLTIEAMKKGLIG